MSSAPPEVSEKDSMLLGEEIDALLDNASSGQTQEVDGSLMALIVPSANNPRRAAVAAEAFALLKGRNIDTAILVNPSHEGSFGRLTICRTDCYQTSLGEVPVDDYLRNELCDEDDDIFIDDQGHYHASGASVQIPFLQRVLRRPVERGSVSNIERPPLSVVPIVMGMEGLEYCRELGHAIGEVMYSRRAVVVASADLISADDEALDQFSDALSAFDVSELMHLLGSEAVRVKGMGAIIVAVLAAQRRGANRARLLKMRAPDGDGPGAFAGVLWRA